MQRPPLGHPACLSCGQAHVPSDSGRWTAAPALVGRYAEHVRSQSHRGRGPGWVALVTRFPPRLAARARGRRTRTAPEGTGVPHPVTTLEEHPNRLEILEVLAQLAMLADNDLERLADVFRNTPSRREARDLALSPDSPLVIEVLSVFGAISTIFADDLAGEEDFISVDPAITAHALKAVRDAVAAAYARPILSRAQHRALMAPWRAVCAPTAQTEPDLGPADAEIRSILSGLPRLAYRCHDARGQEAFADIVEAAQTLDQDEHAAAVETALQASVLLGRRRLWTLVRCNVAERLARRCPLGHLRAVG